MTPSSRSWRAAGARTVGAVARAGGGPAGAGRPRGTHPRGDRRRPGQRPVDAYFDLGLADDLATCFSPRPSPSIWRGSSGYRRRSLPGRAFRRRRARGRHLRRGLRHALLHLGAADRRAEPREGGAQAHPGAGHRGWHPNRGVLEEGSRRPLRLYPARSLLRRRLRDDLACNGRRLTRSPRASRPCSWRGPSSTTRASTAGDAGRILRS